MDTLLDFKCVDNVDNFVDNIILPSVYLEKMNVDNYFTMSGAIKIFELVCGLSGYRKKLKMGFAV